jgi:hypothetical protein
MATCARAPRDSHIGVADLERHASDSDGALKFPRGSCDPRVACFAADTARATKNRAEAAEAGCDETGRDTHAGGILAARNRTSCCNQCAGDNAGRGAVAARAARRTHGKCLAGIDLYRERERGCGTGEALSQLEGCAPATAKRNGHGLVRSGPIGRFAVIGNSRIRRQHPGSRRARIRASRELSAVSDEHLAGGNRTSLPGRIAAPSAVTLSTKNSTKAKRGL